MKQTAFPLALADHVDLGNSMRRYRAGLMRLMRSSAEGSRTYDLARKSVAALDRLHMDLEIQLMRLVPPARDPRRLIQAVYSGHQHFYWRDYDAEDMDTDDFAPWCLAV